MKSFGDMLKQAQKLKQQMSELQDQLAAERFEASSQGGLVKAVVDGKQTLLELTIDPKALEKSDVSRLADLVVTAVGKAQEASEKHMKKSLGRLTGGLPLPF